MSVAALNPVYMQRLMVAGMGAGAVAGHSSNSVKHALLVYTATVVALMTTRPSPVYSEDGHMRDFGSGRHQTILPFWIAATAPALAYLFIVHDSKG